MNKSTADRKYIVEMNWWHKWCDYVNVKFTDQTNILQRNKSAKKMERVSS